ncbi:MAG: beta-hydroxydecanoyl-ACP dehydratase, partial [Frankia sp.]|nr:beta-hydroxydecanoyl-ACP dehydratase [Frankia sp.]
VGGYFFISDRRPGRRRGRGRAPAPVKPAPAAVAALAAAWDAAAVFALYLGLHLVLADAHLDVALPDERLELAAGLGRLTVEVHAPGALAAGEVELSLTVTDVDLVPRPWLRADVHLRNGDGPVATVRGLALAVRERPGAPIGPDEDGTIPGFLGRRGPDGRRALLGELHMAHGARGDLAVALGPQFAASMGRRACRLPSGGLRLVDRFMAVTGRRGELGGGATAVTEYDSPADAWYYTDSPSPTMPNVVHMETSLQSALMLGYYLGATLTDPDEQYCLRNLDGTATVLREVDLAGRTIRQTSTLLSTTVLTGAVLQNFRYELSLVPKDPEDPTSSAEATGTDGSAGSEPFYVGESLFGFFNSTTLANQNGLDGGAFVPTWLERTRPAPASVRTIDVAGRRAAGAPLCATGAMALLDSVTVVPDGGDFGRGYLHATRPVGPDDWYFARHFWLDPVMPGSLGVEAVIQALQEWMVDSGLLDGLAEPRFVMPVGLPMTWRYRGQILADDGELTLEAHIKQVRRQTGRVRVVADASVWKPGLRIYELTDIAAEARGEGAQPW